VSISKEVFLNCEHFYCSCCLRSYIDGEIHSLAISGKHVMMCPIPKCMHAISESEIVRVVGQRKLNRFQRLSLEQVASREKSLSFCPFPDCGMIFSLNDDNRKALAADLSIAQGKASEQTSPRILRMQNGFPTPEKFQEIESIRNRARMACPKCELIFCIICDHDWASCECTSWYSRQQNDIARVHISPEAKRLLSPLSLFPKRRRQQHREVGEDVTFRECGRCGIKIEKESGCDKMKCR